MVLEDIETMMHRQHRHNSELALLADEADTAQRNVEYKQGIYSNANPIPDHAGPAHDADSRS